MENPDLWVFMRVVKIVSLSDFIEIYCRWVERVYFTSLLDCFYGCKNIHCRRNTTKSTHNAAAYLQRRVLCKLLGATPFSLTSR
jgi:hypothetical protein